mmetsp:Transcript_22626/g.25761  ORF Transcript_22626/g.25761 Transcript_22626/m.25761 type:complete len:203 (-) Transcript_22626:96-704(-)
MLGEHSREANKEGIFPFDVFVCRPICEGHHVILQTSTIHSSTNIVLTIFATKEHHLVIYQQIIPLNNITPNMIPFHRIINMSSLPRFVNAVSSFNRFTQNISVGETIILNARKRMEHFPTFCAVTIGASCLSGYLTLNYFEKRWKSRVGLFQLQDEVNRVRMRDQYEKLQVLKHDATTKSLEETIGNAMDEYEKFKTLRANA